MSTFPTNLFPPLARRLLLPLLAVMAAAAPLRAQQGNDSLALDRAIVAEHPDLPFVAAARLRLLRQLRSSDLAGARSMLTFMARRAPSWLTSAERLIAESLIADPTFLRDTARLATLLDGAAREAKGSPYYDDRLYLQERELLRERAEGLEDRFAAGGPSPAELFFYNLLVNHLYARGYYAQERINRRVGEFASKHAGSPLVSIAERYIQMEYGEEPFGAAFTAGYGMGTFSGDLADRFDFFHGPLIGGEAYLYRFTVAAWIEFGVAKAPRPFTAAGRLWEGGSNPLVHASFDLGYELRFGRLALTPVAGLALHSLRAADTAGSDPASLPRTHDRLGLDVGVIVGYRMPFDVGPHIDFRIKLGRAQTALSGYDAGLAGALWYAQLAFALVHRPYQGRSS